jgi:hypothetical protein
MKSFPRSERSLTSVVVSEFRFTSLAVSDRFLTFLPVMVSAAYELPPRARNKASVATTFA